MEKLSYTISKDQWNRIDGFLGHLAKAYSKAMGETYTMKLIHNNEYDYGIYFYRDDGLADDGEIEMYVTPYWIGRPESTAEVLKNAVDILKENILFVHD